MWAGLLIVVGTVLYSAYLGNEEKGSQNFGCFEVPLFFSWLKYHTILNLSFFSVLCKCQNLII